MISNKHSEAARKNIEKINREKKNIHLGDKNPRWNGGNRIVGNHPCPICLKPLKREKRYANLKCVDCSNKKRKPRGPYKTIRTRASYYWEARKIIERSGVKITSDNHIHHINGDWTDNRIENLQVTTKWEHRRKYHNSSSPDFNGFV